MKNKHCQSCADKGREAEHPEMFFAACHRSKDGLASHCRKCQSEYDSRRKRYAEDAERRARKRWGFAHVDGPEVSL